MMAIKKVDSAYIAYHIGDLVLPVSLTCLKDFKQTLDLLFSFKHHHFKLRKIITPVSRRKVNNEVLNMYRHNNTSTKRPSHPGTFFSPKRKQHKRKQNENPTHALTIDSDEDETYWIPTRQLLPSSIPRAFFYCLFKVTTLYHIKLPLSISYVHISNSNSISLWSTRIISISF